MRIIRPIQASDLQQFVELALQTGIGFTSLPKNEQKLKEKLIKSLKAFSPDHTDRQNLIYLFVMEEIETGKIIGMCGIRASTGGSLPSYYYKVDVEPRPPGANRPKEMRILTPVHYSYGPSEICSLYLQREKRHGGWGRLLSFSRFLFIASHLERFSDTIIAEIRGHLDNDLSSQFWEAIGRHFYDLQLAEMLTAYSSNRDFVSDILPSHPIYVDLLPPEAQIEIGTVHEHSQPALNLLLEQGFKITNEIDIIDGGPKLEAPTRKIAAIRQNILCTVKKISDHNTEIKALIANTSLDFRATQGTLHLNNQGEATISPAIAEALQVNVGDNIRYYIIGKE